MDDFLIDFLNSTRMQDTCFNYINCVTLWLYITLKLIFSLNNCLVSVINVTLLYRYLSIFCIIFYKFDACNHNFGRQKRKFGMRSET